MARDPSAFKKRSLTKLRNHVAIPYVISAIIIGLIIFPILLGHEHNFVPTGVAYGWDPGVMLSNFLSDMSIAASYFAIAGLLTYLAHRIKNYVPVRWPLYGFAAFILTCGLTHLMDAYNVYWDGLHLTTIVTYSTAVASVGMASALPPLIPRAINAVQDLALCQQRAKALEELNATLEERIQERTASLQESEAQSKNLVGQLVQAQQAERKHLSYEVHDGFTQTAIATHDYLEAFHHRFHKLTTFNDLEERNRYHDRISPELDEIIQLAAKNVKEARSLIDDLSPTVLDDFGLQAALQEKCTQLNKQGWNIDLTIKDYDGNEQVKHRAHTQSEDALYRIVQEGLQNIAKHAKATHVHICLCLDGKDKEDAHAVLTITDNGRGFDPSLIENTKRGGPGERIGLNAMRNRMHNLGGSLEVFSTPGKGTTIRAEIPLSGSPKEGRDE